MEGARARWTDERLDDFAMAVRTELHALGREMHEGLNENQRTMIGLFLGLYATVLLGIATSVVDAIVR